MWHCRSHAQPYVVLQPVRAALCITTLFDDTFLVFCVQQTSASINTGNGIVSCRKILFAQCDTNSLGRTRSLVGSLDDCIYVYWQCMARVFIGSIGARNHGTWYVPFSKSVSVILFSYTFLLYFLLYFHPPH
jgi:hypothetical protein